MVHSHGGNKFNSITKLAIAVHLLSFEEKTKIFVQIDHALLLFKTG